MSIVYLHKKADTKEVFYVGKAKRTYRAKSKHTRSPEWYAIVKKHGFIHEIIHKDISDDDAYVLEKTFIAWYGRIETNLGTLINKSDEGASMGRVMTTEHKDKIRTALKGRVFTDEWRAKISKSCKGRVSNRKGVKLSEATKRKISNSHKKNKGNVNL